MPSDGRTDWYLGGLVVGTALVFFLLGATATLWLGHAAPPHDTASRVAPGPTAAGPVGGAASAAVNEGAPGRRSSPKGIPSAPAAQAAAPPAASAANPATAPAARPAAADATAPAPPAAAPPGTAAPTGSAVAAAATAGGTAAPAGDFSLQLGAFLDSANAKSLLSQLAVRGYKAMSVEVPDGDGQIWHYIRLGAFTDERTAAAAASAMLDKTGIGAAVIRLSAANAGG